MPLQNYTIQGIHCHNCVRKIKNQLSSLQDLEDIQIDKDSGHLEFRSKNGISMERLQNELSTLDAKYSVHDNTSDLQEEDVSFWIQYKPLILIFSFILLVSLLVQLNAQAFNPLLWMRHFMAGFFIVFSFFKFLDLAGFADNYKNYDIIAKIWHPWGYVYAIIEFGLGISYLINFLPLATNITAFLIMSISIIGVIQSLMQKKKIQCACLGNVFNLPMSTVTLIEDALMILMSGYMIFNILF